MEIHPRWPEFGPEHYRSFDVSYWADIDALIARFDRRIRPTVSVPVDRGDRDVAFLLVDAATEDVVGIQIEDFLSIAVPNAPEIVDILFYAELHGLALERVGQLHVAMRPGVDPVKAEAVIETLVKLAA